MKKELLKRDMRIKVNKETLRRLSSGQLSEVGGGVVTNGGTSCNTSPCNTL
jgi:hypothetical protein